MKTLGWALVFGILFLAWNGVARAQSGRDGGISHNKLMAGLIGPGQEEAMQVPPPPTTPEAWYTLDEPVLDQDRNWGYRFKPRGVFPVADGVGVIFNSSPAPGTGRSGPVAEIKVREGVSADRIATEQTGSIAFSNNLVDWREYEGNPVLYKLQDWQGSRRVMPRAMLYDPRSSRWVVYFGDAEGDYPGIRAMGTVHSRNMVDWEYVSGPTFTINEFAAAIPDRMQSSPEELQAYGRVYPEWAMYHQEQYYILISGTVRTGEGRASGQRTYERVLMRSDHLAGPFEAVEVKGDFVPAHRPVFAGDCWYTVFSGTWDGQPGIGLAWSEDFLGPYVMNPENPIVEIRTEQRTRPQLFCYDGTWAILYAEDVHPGPMHLAMANIDPKTLPHTQDASRSDDWLALRFDGKGDYVVVDDDEAISVTDALTMAFWVKVNIWGEAYNHFVGKGDRTYQIRRNVQGNGVLMTLRGTEEVNVIFSSDIEIGRWHHIVGSYCRDEGIARLYFDGKLEAEKRADLTIRDTTDGLQFGANFNGSNFRRYFDGKLSDIRIYDRALPSEEVCNIYHNRYVSLGDEAGHWKLNEGVDKIAVDSSRHENNGILAREDRWLLADPFAEDLPKVKDVEPGARVVLGPVSLNNPAGDVAYQWHLDGTPLEGQTGKKLAISDITGDKLGVYHVVVNDDRDITPVESGRIWVRKNLPAVAPVDWASISPDTVDDGDIQWARAMNGRLVYHLAHLHSLANAVRDEDPHRGFIDRALYRRPGDNRPHNARIMENITSLTWFYTRDAPWNPYYGDEALRRRIEAAMEFWVSRQSEEGKFSEYGFEDWHLAGTAFATKFMAESIRMLEDGPAIDDKVYEQVLKAQRKAIMVLLDGWRWERATIYSNQYTNVFAGALAYLNLFDDGEMEKKLGYRMRRALDEFCSPAGYMYENIGPDWGYYLGTHHSNVHMIWHYGRERQLPGAGEERFRTFGDIMRYEYERTNDWLSYNAVLQPDGHVFFLNRAIESRQRRGAFTPIEIPLAEVVPLARAFSFTVEEQQQYLSEIRRQLHEKWGAPDPLGGYSAYAFLHHRHNRWFPNEEQRTEAREKLPYIARDRFVHQRMDDRKGQVFTFVRRPAYYAAFNQTTPVSSLFSQHFKNRQGCGLGLIWHPKHGMMLQSDPESRQHSWGTRRAGDSFPREGGGISPVYLVNNAEIEPQMGTRDLPDGDFEVIYKTGIGERRILFGEDHIHVRSIKADGEESESYIEQIPLLLADGDELEVNEGHDRVMMVRDGNSILTIEFGNAKGISFHEGGSIHGFRQVAVHVETESPADYRLRF